MNKTDTKPIIVKIKILDQTGHTTLEQAIDDAIKTAFTYNFTNGKNINVRGENGVVPFELFAKDINDTEGLLSDTIRLHKALTQFEDPLIFITGALAGGAN
jgi:hypothetical protein